MKEKNISCRLQWADPLATVQVEWQGEHLLVICLCVLYLWFLFLASSALGCLAETNREVMSWSGYFVGGYLSPGSWRRLSGHAEIPGELPDALRAQQMLLCAENLEDMHKFEPTGDPKCGLVTQISHCPMSPCSSQWQHSSMLTVPRALSLPWAPTGHGALKDWPLLWAQQNSGYELISPGQMYLTCFHILKKFLREKFFVMTFAKWKSQLWLGLVGSKDGKN